MQCTNPIRLGARQGGGPRFELQVPCGKCLACRISRSREWATRIVHEKDCHEESCFITITYDAVNLPNDGSIHKSELQKFIKRLRKYLDKKIKYFACGEYGELYGRPHYHAIIFGLGIEEAKEVLPIVWKKGLNHVGTVTYDSARYVADYVFKSYNGEKAKEVYGDKQPPFVLMSKGLGKDWALKNEAQIKKKSGNYDQRS